MLCEAWRKLQIISNADLFSGLGIQQSRDFFAENIIRPVDYAVSMFMHNSRVKGLAG